MTLYPNGIDSVLQLLDPAIDGYVAAINATDDAVIAIETELGLDPKGIYSDVATRLSILEGRIGPGATITGGPIDINNANLTGVLTVDKGGTGLNLASSAANPDAALISTGAGIAYGLIVNANVDPAAAIVVSKLAPAATDGYTITTVVGVPTWSSSSSFAVGGDVSGTIGSQTVEKIKGKNLSTSLSTVGATQDGYSLTWVNASSEWQAKPAPGGSFAAGGDLSGSSSSQIVEAIKGTIITTAGGALPVGAVLRTTAVGTADWGAVDLADTDAVTGILPTGNIATILTSKTLDAPTITGTVLFQGTRMRILSIPGEVQTTNDTVTTVVSFAMLDETLCAFDVIVTAALQTNVTDGGRWKRSVVYRRTGAGVPTIVGTLESGTDQEVSAGLDVTIDDDGVDTVRVRVTGLPATTNINWTAELRVQETVATP